MNIKPIEIREFYYSIIKDPVYVVRPNKVRQLEANYKEAIELLNILTQNYISKLKMEYAAAKTPAQINKFFTEEIRLIEKATGEKWEELRK